MSKRFGRNQRRKMREQLDALWYLHDLSAKGYHEKDREIENLRNIGRQMKQTIELTRSVLGDYFVTLPVKTSACQKLPDFPPGFGLPPRNHVRGFDDMAGLDQMLRYVQSAILHGDTRFDVLRQQAHIRFRSDAGDVAYCFAQGAFGNCPAEYVIDTIAHEMAAQLAYSPQFRAFTSLPDSDDWHSRQYAVARGDYGAKP